MGSVLVKSIFSDYLKSLISKINEVYVFFKLHSVSYVLLQSHLLLCWQGFCEISVTLCNVSVTLSKKIIDVYPRYDSMDSTELAEAVLIGR